MITFGELVKRDNDRHGALYHEALTACLERGAFIGGPEIEAFEQQLRDTTGFAFAVGAASGTAALEAAFLALVPEVTTAVVPGVSFVATATAAERGGLDLRFVDVDARGLGQPPADLGANEIYVPVDLYGEHAPLPAGGRVLLDAAQSFGRSSYPDQCVGVCFSFYPTKTLGAIGDAGAFVTNDSGIFQRVKSFLNHGRDDQGDVGRGTTGRLDELQAAFLNRKLLHFSAHHSARREIGAYWAGAAGEAAVTKTGEHASFTLLSGRRSEAQQYFESQGIQTTIYYTYTLPQRLGRRAGVPNSDTFVQRVFSIPISDTLTGAEVEHVYSVIGEAAALDLLKPQLIAAR